MGRQPFVFREQKSRKYWRIISTYEIDFNEDPTLPVGLQVKVTFSVTESITLPK